MKRLIPCLMVVSMCIPATFGAFDYTISDTYEYGIFELNSKSLLVTGAGVDEIDARGHSYVEVQNTAPLEQFKGGIYNLDLDDYSTLNYYGGETGGFSIYDNAEATFSGGSINYISSYQDSDIKKHITFICDVDSVNLTGNLLTGDWLDGKGSFSITLQNQSGYDSVYSNIQFIPEPATLVFLGCGILLLKRSRSLV